MTFREFADECKSAAGALLAGRGQDRDLTPMVLLQTRDDGLVIVAVDNGFFATPSQKALLVHEFVVPMVLDRKATHVAWTMTAVQYVGDEEEAIVLTSVMDREREETWVAPLQGEGIGAWRAAQPNETESMFIQPVQEALR